MSTSPQKDRQLRAKVLVERRIDMWSNMGSDMVEYEGKMVNPQQKLAQAEFELAQLKSKP